jgi:hypothetical protein
MTLAVQISERFADSAPDDSVIGAATTVRAT